MTPNQALQPTPRAFGAAERRRLDRRQLEAE